MKAVFQCEEAREFRSHGRYMAASSRPLSKIMRGDSPPRWSIQRRTSNGYIEYNVCVALGSVILRALEAGFQAAWNPSLAREVTHILSSGTEPRTMVQAETQEPSMITISPELRRPLYLST